MMSFSMVTHIRDPCNPCNPSCKDDLWPLTTQWLTYDSDWTIFPLQLSTCAGGSRGVEPRMSWSVGPMEVSYDGLGRGIVWWIGTWYRMMGWSWYRMIDWVFWTVFGIGEEVARCGGVYSGVELSVVSIRSCSINQFTFDEELDRATCETRRDHGGAQYRDWGSPRLSAAYPSLPPDLGIVHFDWLSLRVYSSGSFRFTPPYWRCRCFYNMRQADDHDDVPILIALAAQLQTMCTFHRFHMAITHWAVIIIHW
jgi:hypothetical protein